MMVGCMDIIINVSFYDKFKLMLKFIRIVLVVCIINEILFFIKVFICK